MHVEITDDLLRGLGPVPAGQSQRFIRDTREPGFAVRQSAKTLAFIVQADATVNGRRVSKRETLGRWPEIRVKEARRLARARLDAIKAGEIATPATVPVATSESVTIRDAFRALERKPRKRPLAQSSVDRNAHVERLLGRWTWTNPAGEREPVIEADLAALASAHGREEMRRLHDRLSDDSADGIGRAGADAVMRVLRSAYNAASRLADDLPMRPPTAAVVWHEGALKEERIERRESEGLKLDQLPAWNAQRLALSNLVRREYHLLALLSGMRRRALAAARWEHLDREQRSLLVPRPKGGPTRRFLLPLSAPMLESIDRLADLNARPEFEDRREWLFPSPTAAAGHVAETKEYATVSGEKVRVLSHTGHALRHVWRTAAGRAGLPRRLSMRIMNHTSGDLHDETYGAVEWAELLEAQEKVSELLMNKMGEGES